MNRVNVIVPAEPHPALQRLRDAGHRVVQVGQGEYEVAGTHHFFTANGYWRAIDGAQRGYQIGTLICALKQRVSA